MIFLFRNYLLILTCLSITTMATSYASPASGSLWINHTKEGRNMVSDNKAVSVGDILTITVSENTQATASQRLRTDRENSVNDEIGRLLFSTATSGRLTHKGELPALNWDGSNQYSGGGEISNRQNLNARVSVIITQSLPNGNLIIEGVRTIVFSDETTKAYISGVIRPQDIRSDNTILSSNIAQAHVEFINDGSISKNKRKGWLSRFYEAINPF